MKQKTVLITGASRGIGQAAALLFAQEGYYLVLNCMHSADELNALSKIIETKFSVKTLCCCGDISDYAFVSHMFGQIEAFCGGIDILINNAGISYIGLLSEMSPEDWNRVISTNLTSVFSCCKCAIPYMVSQKFGKIINVSSDWGIYGASCETAYSAAKGGMNAFTRALAKELAPSNIQVNAAAFGVIDTDMNQNLDESERRQLEDEIPSGYFATPKEAAAFLLQLAKSPAYLTGQVISFDGGWF